MEKHKTVKANVWYLQMKEEPFLIISRMPENIEILRLENPTIIEYKELYNKVGEKWNWYKRLIIPENELEDIITNPLVEIYLLTVSGNKLGFYELDRRNGDEIELAYFGVIPGSLGEGFGKLMLQHMLITAWSYKPSRLWLHTCEFDSPHTVNFYLESGFEIYDIIEEDHLLFENE